MARSAEQHRKEERERQRIASAIGRDVAASCPKCTTGRRRNACRYDLLAFLNAHFSNDFWWDWSEDQIRSIHEFQDVILNGGNRIDIRPRGTGKTAIAKRVVPWALLYGHRDFVAIIAATVKLAKDFLAGVRELIEGTESLYKDFPKPIHAIRSLNGIANLQAGQTWNGKRTKIKWGDELHFPRIVGEPSSGAICTAIGIEAAHRGLNITVAGEGDRRPDLIIPDDPQTDETAASDEATEKLFRTLVGSIRGMKGNKRALAMAGLMTVIRENDLTCRCQKLWHGRIVKMLPTMPTNMKLWEAYWEVRETAKEQGESDHDAMLKATKFYKSNRKAMDEGASASWPAHFTPPEISAIQHGMNEYFVDPQTFFAEYQNEPQGDNAGSSIALRFEDMKRRISTYDRLVVPHWATRMTAHIDAGEHVHWYSVWAFSDGFRRSHCVDYGTFPRQHDSYFSKESVGEKGISLKRQYAGYSVAEAMTAGFNNLTEYLFSPDRWVDEMGIPVDKSMLAAVGIDMADGDFTEMIRDYCTRHEESARLVPCQGASILGIITAINKNRIRRRTGEVVGSLPWIENRHAGKGLFLRYDTNWWKTNFARSLQMEQGGTGEVTFFRDTAFRHRLHMEHLCAETGSPKKSSSLTETQWIIRKSAVGNDWWDTDVAARVLAAYKGLSMPDYHSERPEPQQETIKYSERQKEIMKRKRI